MREDEYPWLSRAAFAKPGQVFGFVRQQLERAESLFDPDMPDDLLLRLHVFVTDGDDEFYEVLKLQTEIILARRMGEEVKTPLTHDEYPGSDEDHVSRSLQAVASGRVPNKELIETFLHSEVCRYHSKNVAEWQAVYDLARLQILRRMQLSKPLLSVADRSEDALAIPDDATISSAAETRKMPNYDWLDYEYEYVDHDEFEDSDEADLGYAREELRLAEEAFDVSMPDELLLRYYRFVMDNGDEDYGIWSVIRDKTEHLMLSRIHGGPEKREAKYVKGFDPKDHAAAFEAIANDALPYRDLLVLYRVAWSNKNSSSDWNEDREHQPYWAPVFDLLREKILSIMAACRNEQPSEMDQQNGLSATLNVEGNDR
jgi:hypothetical protein